MRTRTELALNSVREPRRDLLGRRKGRHAAPTRARTRVRVVTVLLAITGTVLGLAPAAFAYTATAVGPTAWVPNGAVHSAVTDGSTVYVGGAFTGGVVALSADGGRLLWRGNANGDVTALALNGGQLLMGGAFTTVGGTTHRKLASVNAGTGAVNNTFKPSVGGTVRDIVVANGIAYFGGAFTNQNGITQGGLGAVDATTGQVVPAFNATTNGQVYALGTDGNRLFIGGKFTAVNGQTRNELASVTLSSNTLDTWAPAAACTGCNVVWDLTLDNSRNRVYTVGRNGGTGYTVDKNTGAFLFKVTGGVNGDSQAVTLAPDGKLYIGGHFTSISGQPIMLVAAFDVSGTRAVIDPTFSAKFVTSYPGVWALASTSNYLYVGGAFTAVKVNGVNKFPYFAIFPGSGGGTGGGDTTPPTVTTTSPAGSATGVDTATSVTATFSEPVTGVDGTTFTLASSAGPVSATVTGSGTTTGTLTPGAPLTANTTYTTTLTNAITDNAGNAFAGTTWTFTTAAAGGGSGDTTAPTVTNRSPNPGATGVAATANVTATFSEPVNNVGTGTFTLADQTGATVTATVTQNSNNPQKWILNPSGSLAAGTLYTATLVGDVGGITDVAGNPLAGNVTWSFTVTGTSDTTAPTVTNRSPNPGAMGVSATANVTATFSEPVSNVGPGTFTLADQTGATVTATVTQNSNNPLKWMLNPGSSLKSGATYTATLVGGAGGITDLAGNPLAATVTWTFTIA